MSHAEKVLTVAVLAALAWAVAQAQPPIRIGASLAQTGASAAPGQNHLRGYQLCVKHMNDKGGVLGRKLELVVYDDGSDPAAAVRLYEQLITQDKVNLVLGPNTGPITDAVADVTEKYKLPMVATPGATSIYRKGRKFIFSMNPPGEVFLEAGRQEGDCVAGGAGARQAALPDAAVEPAPVRPCCARTVVLPPRSMGGWVDDAGRKREVTPRGALSDVITR